MKEAKKTLRAAVRAAGVNTVNADVEQTNGAAGAVAGSPPVEGCPEGAGWFIPVEQIESLPQFSSARTVALYCSLPDEVPTDEMLRRWLGKKRLVLPAIDHPAPSGHPSTGGEPLRTQEIPNSPPCKGVAVCAEAGSPPVEGWQPKADGVVEQPPEMAFREYTGPDCLCVGAFGIRTPRHEAVITAEEIDLMLIPGVAFDPAGRRLGRGKGFYDRYLSQPAAAHIYKVGLCLPHAMVAEVPAEPHDIGMDAVITASIPNEK